MVICDMVLPARLLEPLDAAPRTTAASGDGRAGGPLPRAHGSRRASDRDPRVVKSESPDVTGTGQIALDPDDQDHPRTGRTLAAADRRPTTKT